jgi:hypothetical protein
MKMPVLLQCTHSKAKKQVIVDSGVMSNFISSEAPEKNEDREIGTSLSRGPYG